MPSPSSVLIALMYLTLYLMLLLLLLVSLKEKANYGHYWFENKLPYVYVMSLIHDDNFIPFLSIQSVQNPMVVKWRLFEKQAYLHLDCVIHLYIN